MHLVLQLANLGSTAKSHDQWELHRCFKDLNSYSVPIHLILIQAVPVADLCQVVLNWSTLHLYC